MAGTSSEITYGYVYCRYTEPMAVRDILAALVRQLLEQHPSLISVGEALFRKHTIRKTIPTQEELLGAIHTICSNFRIVYLFVDGLDEALYDEQFDLLGALKFIRANFFITSRPLKRLEDVVPNARFFDIVARDEDVKVLVLHQIDRSPGLREVLGTGDMRSRVADKICQSSCGM